MMLWWPLCFLQPDTGILPWCSLVLWLIYRIYIFYMVLIRSWHSRLISPTTTLSFFVVLSGSPFSVSCWWGFFPFIFLFWFSISLFIFHMFNFSWVFLVKFLLVIWVSFVLSARLSCSITVFFPLVNFYWGNYFFVFILLFFILYLFFFMVLYCAFFCSSLDIIY